MLQIATVVTFLCKVVTKCKKLYITKGTYCVIIQMMKYAKNRRAEMFRRFFVVQIYGKAVNGMADKLSRKEQTIVNYKANGGNMKKAMIDAGYSETYADRNSKYLLGIIGEQIKSEQEGIKAEGIKTVAEIQQWWSKKMDDPKVADKDKIRCSENLARSQGGFVDNVQLNGQLNNNPYSGLTTEELKKLIEDD